MPPKHDDKLRALAEKLCDAACTGNLSSIKSLVKQGAQLNLPTKQHFLPLYVAVCSRQEEAAIWLCNNGADVRAIGDGGSDGNTVLHIACGTNQFKICEKLIAMGAVVGAQNKKGGLPIDFAANSEGGVAFDCIKLLLENGAKDATFRSKVKSGEFLRMLVMRIDERGLKTESSDVEIAKTLVLLEQHKLLGEGSGGFDHTSAHSEGALFSASRLGLTRVVRILLRLGQTPKVTKQHNPPLHVACEKGHLDIVRLLLAAGASTRQGHEACGASGSPPIILALLFVTERRLEVAQALYARDEDCLDAGVNMPSTTSGKTMTIGQQALCCW